MRIPAGINSPNIHIQADDMSIDTRPYNSIGNTRQTDTLHSCGLHPIPLTATSSYALHHRRPNDRFPDSHIRNIFGNQRTINPSHPASRYIQLPATSITEHVKPQNTQSYRHAEFRKIHNP